jgi:ABC-type glycerol-3-phosphate transport system substrate-binding protein
MDTTPATTKGARWSRRALLGRAAAAGAAGIVGGAAVGRGAPARRPAAGGRVAAAAARVALSGKIVVSFADEGDVLPAYVAGAAEAVVAANPGAEIEVDHQAISAGEYATRLFLAMRAGGVPDVFHLTGAAIGALAAGGVIRPLDELLAAWPDWAFYP